MEASYHSAEHTDVHALGIAHSTRREQHQSWLLPLHGCIDEPVPGLADFTQNFQGLSTHNKWVTSTSQNWLKTSGWALTHAVRFLRRASELCVRESLDHEQKMSRVKQVEGI
jgi:hypothetical protein